MDFSVSKRFPLGATRLGFRAEIFNLFNHTNFGQPDGAINNVAAGVISTADDGCTEHAVRHSPDVVRAGNVRGAGFDVQNMNP